MGGPEVRVGSGCGAGSEASSKAPGPCTTAHGSWSRGLSGPGLGAIRVNRYVRGGDYNQGPVVPSPTLL